VYAEAEVRAGIAFLDERADDEWRQEINLETLDMRDEYACVFGQLFGDYTTAQNQFGLTAIEASALGFYRCDGFWYPVQEHELVDAGDSTNPYSIDPYQQPWERRYELLTATWKELLQPVAV
jgi:hypothetical protein